MKDLNFYIVKEEEKKAKEEERKRILRERHENKKNKQKKKVEKDKIPDSLIKQHLELLDIKSNEKEEDSASREIYDK